MTTNAITAYKGFRHDMTCRGMQYTVGETHTHDGDVVACRSGLHASLYPLDVLRHYSPHTSRFAVVEADNYVSSDDKSDTKIATRTLRVLDELTPCQLVDAAASQVESGVTLRSASSSKFSYAVGTTAGAKVSTAGEASGAVSTHHNSMSLAVGIKSVAATTGEYSLAKVAKQYGVAAVTSQSSVAHTYAPNTIAAASNAYSAAKAEGAHSIAASTGGYGIVTSTHPNSIAASTGTASFTVSENHNSIAAATGAFSAARALHLCSAAIATGGDSSAAAEGADSVAIALGRGSRARAEEGGFIVCGYRNSAGHLLHLRVAKVGENGTKPGVWYKLDAHGEFVEVEL